jgi:hypothetical protein
MIAKKKLDNKSYIQKHSIAFVLLFIIGAYLDIPLVLSRSFSSIPSITNLLLTIALFPLLYKQYNKKDIRLIAYLFVVVISTIVFSGNIIDFPSRIVKIIQYLVAIFMFTFVLKIIVTTSSSDLKKLFFYLSIFFVVGITLEYFNIIRGISDGFRNIAYSNGSYVNYDSEERDIFMTGFIRPNFFTTEPSLVAIAFFIFTSCFLLLSVRISSFLLILILDLVFFSVCGSPITILNFIAILIIYTHRNRSGRKLFFIVSAFLLFIISILVAFPKIGELIQQRLILDLTNESESTYTRLYVPYAEALPKALNYNPFFGVGFGGKKTMTDITGNTGADTSLADSREMEFIIGSNGFACMLIFQGIIGFLLTLYILKKYLKKRYGFKNFSLFIIIWFLFSQTMGAYETPRFWVYTSLVVGCLIVFEKNKILKNKEINVQPAI